MAEIPRLFLAPPLFAWVIDGGPSNETCGAVTRKGDTLSIADVTRTSEVRSAIADTHRAGLPWTNNTRREVEARGGPFGGRCVERGPTSGKDLACIAIAMPKKHDHLLTGAFLALGDWLADGGHGYTRGGVVSRTVYACQLCTGGMNGDAKKSSPIASPHCICIGESHC